ncbi:efflux RND transporter periplasmic adaptor subunit [Pedosphaera parvula]|uniref:Efflux transporter, RND family, MFP subunit n=1 Tax=Pedosphaera parvula (strain Ellin514) TaxID=320771 RepID=B9XJL3_PEDPL|nr:efflux RND transporter periplasmic adaptor subunit [Pedosphaera parvula]EEF59889.1 efflux transporter, RND family, MFP subunit [Pedosphaera parvula Ellin514]
MLKRDSVFSLVTLLVVIVLLAVAAGTGIWIWKNQGEKEPEFRTAQVTKGDLIQAVTATGQLNPVTNVQVGSQISGIIDKLYADFNTTVTNGQLIAQIDPATYKAALMQSQGDLANAKATLELAQVEAKRAEELSKNRLISQSDYDKAVATLHQSEANVQIKDAAVVRSKVDLDRTTIFSPIDGIVISRNVDIGQTVAASLSAPTLYVIANDLSKMQIDAVVSEADIGGIETNQTVNFTVDAFPTRNFHGTVWQVRNSPITNQNVISYDTVIGVDNKDQKLKPGMTANVSIVAAQRNETLKIPNGALRFRPQETGETKKPAVSPVLSNAVAQASGGVTAPEGGTPGQARPDGANGGNGRPGGGGRRSAGQTGHAKGEHGSPIRTVYVLAQNENGKGQAPKPIQIKIGISDGVNTEVLEGLKEGDQVIVGQLVVGAAPAAAAPSNPFGGGGMRRF